MKMNTTENGAILIRTVPASGATAGRKLETSCRPPAKPQHH